MPLARGQSGTPSGRPKILLPDGRSLQDLAREHTEAAVNALIGVLAGGEGVPAAAIVSAASAILDRGWGKPKQDVDFGGEGVDVLAEILARIDGRTRTITTDNRVH